MNTDKYEGHTPAPWNVFGPYPLLRCGDYDDEGVAQPLPFTQADVKLIADAPLLLEEVKRLREESKWMRERLCRHIGDDYCKSEYMKHFGREMIE